MQRSIEMTAVATRPELRPGTWRIDPVASSVGFTATQFGLKKGAREVHLVLRDDLHARRAPAVVGGGGYLCPERGLRDRPERQGSTEARIPKG